MQGDHSRLRRLVFFPNRRLITVHTRLAGSVPLGIVRCGLDGGGSGRLNDVSKGKERGSGNLPR